MRFSSLLVAAILAGCGLEPSPEGGRRRDALPMVPSAPFMVGRQTGAALGTSVATCRLPGFVAGAPGDNSLFLALPDGGRWFDAPGTWDAGGLGVAVACEGGPTTLTVVTGGFLGTWTYSLLGVPVVLRGESISALARGPTTAAPLLQGSAETGTVKLEQWSGAGFLGLNPMRMETPGFGASLAWDPGGAVFAVGDPVSGTVRAYGWNGALTDAGQVDGPGASGFGAAVAIGDVHPNAGNELIIGVPTLNKVIIYGESQGGLPVPVMVLSGASGGANSGFGFALAVEPNPVAGNLHALWVGDPLNDRAIRFVGDAGDAIAPLLGGGFFGYSLATSEQDLIVGEPGYSDGLLKAGAIYKMALNPTLYPNGVPMQCNRGSVCVTPTCQTGSCLGGVICRTAGNPLCPAAQCINGVCDLTFDAGGRPDAGAPDAGPPDAGPPDAGPPDAGPPDAGPPDAGPPDAGPPDAGPPDAGPPDAGGRDAGPPDAGRDAGEPDAGTADGGLVTQKFGTCGCSGAGAVPLVLLSMAWGRRGRRRRE